MYNRDHMTENYEPNYLDDLNLEIDQDVSSSIKEASKWAKFISILIFIFCGFMILTFILLSVYFTNVFSRSMRRYNSFFVGLEGPGFFIIMIIALLFFGVLYYFLFNFSRKAKSALLSENIEDLNKGFNSLKIYFIIYAVMGILGIISSAISLLKLL